MDEFSNVETVAEQDFGTVVTDPATAPADEKCGAGELVREGGFLGLGVAIALIATAGVAYAGYLGIKAGVNAVKKKWSERKQEKA